MMIAIIITVVSTIIPLISEEYKILTETVNMVFNCVLLI